MARKLKRHNVAFEIAELLGLTQLDDPSLPQIAASSGADRHTITTMTAPSAERSNG